MGYFLGGDRYQVAKSPFVAQLDRKTKSSCFLLLSVSPCGINHSGSVFHHADARANNCGREVQMAQVLNLVGLSILWMLKSSRCLDPSSDPFISCEGQMATCDLHVLLLPLVAPH
jgi:hypothetical protein